MNEYIEAKDLDDFRDEIMSEFLSLCNYNDYNEITLLRIGETIDKIYDKYYSKPLADVESKREWIPVTERLPEVHVPVLTFGRKGSVGIGFIQPTSVKDGKVYFYARYGDSLPTHWMPLPEPPEAEKGR